MARMVTRKWDKKIQAQFAAAEKANIRGAIQALVTKYPKEAAHRYMPLRTIIEKVNEVAFMEEDWDVLRGLLDMLTRPKDRYYWRMLVYGLSLGVLGGELGKVGRCPVCGLFFLALRKDAKCCCRIHSNVFRARKCRGITPEEYRPRRSPDPQERTIAKEQRSSNTRIRQVIENFAWESLPKGIDWRQWIADKANVSVGDLIRTLRHGEQGEPDGVRLTKAQARYFREFEKGAKP